MCVRMAVYEETCFCLKVKAQWSVTKVPVSDPEFDSVGCQQNFRVY